MNDNRRKLTGILKLLYENTDAEHSMDTYQIMDALESIGYGRPDRKTIDSNIKFIIEDLGMGVKKEKGKPNRYRWIDREFDLSELKMLVDAVHSSRFISKRKSREIIAKLKDFTSVHQASTLNREMYTTSTFKHDGSIALANADIINEAIKSRQRVRFSSTCYDIDKCEIIDPEETIHEVSPYALLWNNDFYYMLGMPTDDTVVRSYRVDKITNLSILHIDAVPKPYDFYLDKYSVCVFDMLSGDTRDVVLKCKNHNMDDLIDKFGHGFYSERIDSETFSAKVTVDTSPAFYAWIFKFGGNIKIVEPESVKAEYKEMLRNQLDQ